MVQLSDIAMALSTTIHALGTMPRMDVQQRPLFVEREIAVKTYDIDFAGHVSNIVYIRWLEDLRLAVLEEYFPLEKQMREGYAPVLTRTEIDYKAPIRLFDRVVARMWARDAGLVRMALEAEFLVGERLCATARQQGVMARLADGRPIRLPGELRALMTTAGGRPGQA
jgi:acyl-CoA thioester hydrolase